MSDSRIVELMRKYADAKTGLIIEYSLNMDADVLKLVEELQDYRYELNDVECKKEATKIIAKVANYYL